MSRERWRDLPGWVGFYQVSDRGRVRSLRRTIITVRGKVSLRRRLLLQPLAHGYPHVSLHRGRKQFTRKVHRLVLEAFVGPRPFKTAHARHLNGNPTDNRLENLCWGTPQENRDDSKRHGRIPHGADHTGSLNDEAAFTVWFLGTRRIKRTSLLARLYHVPDSTICYIKSGKGYGEVIRRVQARKGGVPSAT